MTDREYLREKYRAEDSGPGILEENVEQWEAIWQRFDDLLRDVRDLDACAGYALEDYIHDNIAPALETARDALNDFLMGEDV